MSLGEFRRWATYLAEEPTLAERVDLIGGVITSTIANVNRGKSSKSYTALDFMPIALKLRESVEETMSEEAFSALQLRKFRAAMGG